MSGAFPGSVDGSLLGLSHEMFQFGEDLFDGVEVGEYRLARTKPGSASPDGAAHRLALVATEIIEDDDVARLQRWGQNLIDIGPEALAVDWTIENPWGLDTITPQGGEEGHCLPVTVGMFAASLRPRAHHASDAVSPRCSF